MNFPPEANAIQARVYTLQAKREAYCELVSREGGSGVEIWDAQKRDREGANV